MNIKEWQKEAWETADKTGWHEGPPPDMIKLVAWLGLVGTEVAEAIECVRSRDMAPRFNDVGKPEGFPSELADIVLRVLEYAEIFGVDLEAAMIVKNSFNKTRPYRHGNKVI